MVTKSSAFLALLLLSLQAVLYAQNPSGEFTTDSVELRYVVKKVIESHPSVLKAEEAVRAAEAGIGMAKANYYPDVDLGAGYTRIGPVPSITIPEMGSFRMAPYDNYNTTLNVRETVYDFSRTKSAIRVAETGRELADKNVDLVKQRLSLLTITTFYSISYLQEAVQIKETQLGILGQHLDYITRKKETGSATDYEILSTKVRISNAQNQKMDLETALDNQLAVLNALLGLPGGTRIKVRTRLMTGTEIESYESLLNYALAHRDELLLTGIRQKQAELKLQSLKLDLNPVVSAFASGGIKNGYFPDLNQPKFNYAAGLGIKVPLYTATRHRNQLQLADTDVRSVKLDLEQSRRDISSEVFQALANLEASKRKISLSMLQLQQAKEARNLADLSFRAGTITNLDLLDSESFESESSLNLMKARIDYMVNAARLEIAVGKQGY